jgi:hypothetical protein
MASWNASRIRASSAVASRRPGYSRSGCSSSPSSCSDSSCSDGGSLRNTNGTPRVKSGWSGGSGLISLGSHGRAARLHPHRDPELAAFRGAGERRPGSAVAHISRTGRR